MAQSLRLLNEQTGHTCDVLKQTDRNNRDVINGILAGERKVQKFKNRLPWLGLGSVVLILMLLMTLPRFMGNSALTCAALGAS